MFVCRYCTDVGGVVCVTTYCATYLALINVVISTIVAGYRRKGSVQQDDGSMYDKARLGLVANFHGSKLNTRYTYLYRDNSDLIVLGAGGGIYHLEDRGVAIRYATVHTK